MNDKVGEGKINNKSKQQLDVIQEGVTTGLLIAFEVRLELYSEANNNNEEL